MGRPLFKTIRTISPIWIVPMAALVIALGLGLRAWEQRGAQIEIVFDNASGIEVGKTRIRLKDVEVGRVTAVKLTPDLRQVRVEAELDKSVSRHLSRNTRFWVVTPRISASGVSNLGTIISGVYIVMDPGEPGPDQSVFVGLNEPPAVTSGEEGRHFILQAEELGSLDIGSPVYYRQFKVGEITSYHLAEGGEYVAVSIFVPAPYDQLVQTRSRFWNVSGIGFKLGADGVEAQMESLASLISGGIAFDNSVGFEGSSVAEEGQRFLLYEDKDSVLAGRYSTKYYYLLKFSSSVRGLSVGAPVEFQGISVGEVVDITLNSTDKNAESVHVFVAIEPERLELNENPSRVETDRLIANMVQQGLHARLKSGNLITGSRYVDLAFYDEPPGQLVRLENYSEMPTIDDSLDQISRELASVVDKLNKIPFDTIGRDVGSAMASINRTVTQLEEQQAAQKLGSTLTNVELASRGLDETLSSAQQALVDMQRMLRNIDRSVAPDSELHYEMLDAVKAVEQAAKSFDALADELSRYPDALIFGVEKE